MFRSRQAQCLQENIANLPSVLDHIEADPLAFVRTTLTPEPSDPVYKGLYNCMIGIASDSTKQDLLEVRQKLMGKNKSNIYEKLCKMHCKPIDNHCDFVDWSSFSVVDDVIKMNYSCGVNTISLSGDVDVCDGFADCPNRADEAICSTRFYCMDGSISIPFSNVCDEIPDCGDLSDECQQCPRKNLADDKHMISNRILVYYMVVLFFLITVLNAKGMYGHGTRLLTQTRSTAKVNNILCLQLCIYDFLMGIYIFIITLKNFQFYGTYCINDTMWRSSNTCDLCGFIFTFSSHGSLMTALIMGAVRCYNCENMLVHFSVRRVVAGLVIALALNVLISAAALLPWDFFTNIFQTTVYFEGNRLLKKGSRAAIDILIAEYYGPDHPVGDTWSSKLALLSNMTSSPDMFQPTKTFGFFNQSPLCIQNLFSKDSNPVIRLIKTVYISLQAIIVVFFSICYIWIVFIRYRSNSAAPSLRNNDKQKKKLTRKVTLIVCSQLLAWIPIIIATIITLADRKVPITFYEIVAIVLIPANSALNPLFHNPREQPGKQAHYASSSAASRVTVDTVISRSSLTQLTVKKRAPEKKREKEEAGDAALDDISKEKNELKQILVGLDLLPGVEI